jgi:hypothetical protein
VPKSKPPSDPNEAARSILDQITGDKPKVVPDKKNSAAVELGRLGGVKGGAARAKALSPEQRTRIAAVAARKRWGKPKSDA